MASICYGDGLTVDENGRLVPAVDRIQLGHVGNQDVGPPSAVILWDVLRSEVEQSGDTFQWNPGTGAITVLKEGLYMVIANHRDSPGQVNVGAQIGLAILRNGVRTGGVILTRSSVNSHRLEGVSVSFAPAGTTFQAEWSVINATVAGQPYPINGDDRNFFTIVRLA